MYCKHCASPLGENAKFCPNCGAPINESENRHKPHSTVKSNGIIKTYSDFWIHYFDFKGRTTRSVFWTNSVINIIIALIILIIAISNYDDLTGEQSPLYYLLLLFGVVAFCPQLALIYRRFNDAGKPKWLIFSPILLFFVCIFFVNITFLYFILLLGLIGHLIYNIYIVCLDSKDKGVHHS